MRFLFYALLLASLVQPGLLQAKVDSQMQNEPLLQNESQWKLEVLITSPSFQSLETAFGHSALLLIPPGQPVEQGTVWSFLANTDTIDSRNWKSLASGALFGKFPFVVQQEPALSFFSRHLIYESRDIQRLIIPATPQQSERLRRLVERLEADPSSLGQYFFRSENCMAALLRALQQSGFKINLNQLKSTTSGYGMIPKQLPVFLENLLITYLPRDFSLSLSTQIKNLEKNHRLELESKLHNGNYLDWSWREKQILTHFNLHELAVASYSLAIDDEPRLTHIRNLLANKPGQTSSIFRLKDFPASFYRSCTQPECARSIKKDLVEVYNENELRRIHSTLIVGFDRSRQLFMPEFKLQDSPQALNWRLLRDLMRQERASFSQTIRRTQTTH